MLRTPAAFDLPHALDPETSLGYLGFVFSVTVITLIGAYLELRRLKIAEHWVRTRAFPENELLHNVRALLMPVQLLRSVGFLAFFEIGYQSEFCNIVAYTCLSLTLAIFIGISRREHGLIGKIRNTKVSFARSSGLFVRVAVGFGILAALSTVAALFAVAAASYVIDSPIAKTIIFLASVVTLQLMMVPIMGRFMLPNRSARGTEQEGLINEAFDKMGRAKPQVRILELNDFKIFNAMIMGLGFMPGVFKQAIFISEAPELGLTRGELKAIIHHELAHGYLNHLPIRVVAAISINTLLLLPTAAFALSLPYSGWLYGGFGLLFLLSVILVQPLLLGRIVRDQEKQADEFAVFKMGSSIADLVAGLAKITEASGGLRDRSPPGSWLNASAAHPTVDERGDHLMHVETRLRHARGESDTLAARLSPWRLGPLLTRDRAWRSLGGVCLASCAALLVSYAVGESDHAKSTRSPASASDSKAVEKYLRRARG